MKPGKLRLLFSYSLISFSTFFSSFYCWCYLFAEISFAWALSPFCCKKDKTREREKKIYIWAAVHLKPSS